MRFGLSVPPLVSALLLIVTMAIVRAPAIIRSWGGFPDR